MVYLKWLALLLPSILMDIVGRLVAPILPFFVSKDGYLPKWLWWFQTPDNSLDGDRKHKLRWPKNGRFWTYLRRVAWLTRNCGYAFNISVLGYKPESNDTIVISGNPNIGDLSGISGHCTWKAVRDGEKLVSFQYYYVKHYRLFNTWKCIRIGLGWKIWSHPSSKVYGQYWVYFHPIKGSGLE